MAQTFRGRITRRINTVSFTSDSFRRRFTNVVKTKNMASSKRRVRRVEVLSDELDTSYTNKKRERRTQIHPSIHPHLSDFNICICTYVYVYMHTYKRSKIVTTM